MKRVSIVTTIIYTFLSFSFLFKGDNNSPAIGNIVVQFITTNLMSNNLYIDNISIGTRFNYDMAAISINNIAKDTSFSINGNNSFRITPRITFLNEGKIDITNPFNVFLQVTPGTYSSTKQIASLNNKRAIEVVFDSLDLNPNISYLLKAWSQFNSEQNPLNDTLIQNSYYLPGAARNILFEAYTNVSCGPCATNNPYLDSFIVAHFDTIVAIKYHTWWPSQNDPMYLHNTIENRNRVLYYPINNVPVLNVDGVYLNIYPYTNSFFLSSPYRIRLSNGSPIGLNVVDTRIPGDTIKADITLNIYSPLPNGNYRMRLNAIERYIHYANPPGGNAEKDFYDVFRKMYPDTNGIPIPISPGSYSYSIKYKRNTVWNDTMIYSVVYVQNDSTKEVINSAKARHQVFYSIKNQGIISLNKKFEVPGNKKSPLKADSTAFSLVHFETGIPPSGWIITNTDNVNFSPCSIANGPSFGGTKSIAMLLVSANWQTPSYHYLKSGIFNNINLDDSIKFDWAYAPYGGESVEGLKVQLSTDGGITFPFTIFNRVGNALATAPTTSEAFVPADSSQWGTFGIKIGNVIGIGQISSKIPKNCVLYQNYPNPFNPATIINYELPITNYVKLVIYDVTGREIAVIVNQKQNPGTYQVEWNASSYPSGVYFYKINTVFFTETKKMIFLK